MKFNPSQLAALGSLLCLLPASAAVIVPVDTKQSNAFGSLRLASNMLNSTGINVSQTTLYNHDGSPSGEPNSANNSQWSTTAKVNTGAGRTIALEVAAGKVWVVLDLGATFDLTSIKLWNFNWDNTAGTPLTSLNNRGISQFDIYVRNTVADTSDGTVGGTAINLTGVSDATNALSNAPVFDVGITNPWTLALSNQSLAVSANNDTSNTGQSFNLTGNTARFIAIKADTYFGDAGGVGLGKVRIEGIPEPAAALLGVFGFLTLLPRRR